MQPIAVAKRYARALADSAGGNELGRLEAVASDLALAAKVLGADAKFAHFFADPSNSQEDKRGAIETLARRAKLSEVVRSFLLVLVANRRLGALGAIRDCFEAITDERVAALFYSTFIVQGRLLFTEFLSVRKQFGELRDELDVEAAAAMFLASLTGALLTYELFGGKQVESFDDERMLGRMCDTFLHGIVKK